MISTLPGYQNTIGDIAERLGRRVHQKQYAVGRRTRAAVAMIMRELADDLEILFIERATDLRDPWSGHLAFPGGKVEQGEQARQAAERETREEIGLVLESERYLGRMSDIVGANLPVQVSCFAYAAVSAAVRPVVSPEVRDVFWVRLSDIRDPQRHRLATVGFSGRSLEVPAIILPQADKPVLWGLTYRLVMQFLEIIQTP
ncbi:MAG: CoA pyrophosphatase [Desulfobacteraceae bacterium]|nr:CoA pyrophosphatase [Desulfobacteraceae bacterium]